MSEMGIYQRLHLQDHNPNCFLASSSDKFGSTPLRLLRNSC